MDKTPVPQKPLAPHLVATVDFTNDTRPAENYQMRIARDGTWFYRGTPIVRTALAKLFSTVLKRDGAGDYWLVTPAERGRIEVEDVPFVAVEMKAEGAGENQKLSFRTNLDDWATAGPEHPIRLADGAEEGGTLSDARVPYILVRGGLEARLGRAVFYELVELAVERQTPQGTELGVWSERIFFPLGLAG
jgi:hypothetical protein